MKKIKSFKSINESYEGNLKEINVVALQSLMYEAGGNVYDWAGYDHATHSSNVLSAAEQMIADNELFGMSDRGFRLMAAALANGDLTIKVTNGEPFNITKFKQNQIWACLVIEKDYNQPLIVCSSWPVRASWVDA